MIKNKPIKWEKVHVFISSTFNDMHAERDYLVKKVFPELQEWCERRKLRLVDIDLRWGVTEQDATHNKNAVKVCLERIDECRPFFLCFLGQRRGWVPQADEVSGDTFDEFPDLRNYVGRSSVTELEILHALISPLHRGVKYDPEKSDEKYEKARYAYFYLRDDSYLIEIPSETPMLKETYTNEGIEEPLERELHNHELEKWREAIERLGRPFHHYTASWDGNATTPEIMIPLSSPSDDPKNISRWRRQWAKAGVDIKGLDIDDDPAQGEKARKFNNLLSRGRLTAFRSADKELKEIILEDLKVAIKERHPDHVEAIEETELQKELDQQEEFLYINSGGFIEREGAFEELDQYLADDSRKLFALTAPGGMGKTMLLANWIDRCKNRTRWRRDYSFHFRFVGQSDGSTTLANLLRSLMIELQQVANKIPATTGETVEDRGGNKTIREIPFEIPRDPIKLKNLWKVQLPKIGKNGKTVIVLDALNQLDTGLKDLAWLPLFGLPENIKFIVSFREDSDDSRDLKEKLIKYKENICIARVKPFEDLGDRRRLVKAYLSQFLKEIDQKHLEEIIRLEGAGNPLFLKVVLSELRVFGSFANLADKMRSDFGGSPVSAFDGVLTRLEKDPVYSDILPKASVPLLFGLMAHARRGLSTDELAVMFMQTFGEGGMINKMGALETAYLFLRQVRPFLARKNGRYDYFYETFRIAALERYTRRSPKEVQPRRLVQEWHQTLGRYFDSLPLWKAGGESNKRKLEELPYHQTMMQDSNSLEKTLTDFSFVKAKCLAGMFFDLIRDCDFACKHHSLSSIAKMRKALSLAQSSLLARPELAVQTLYNRLIWVEINEPALIISLENALQHLESESFWISAEAPLPGIETLSKKFIPFEIKSVIQSVNLKSNSIAIASFQGEVQIIDLEYGETLDTRNLDNSRVVSIALQEDKTSLTYMDADGVIRSDQEEETLLGRRGEQLLLHHSTHGVISVVADNSLVAWKVNKNEPVLLAADIPKPLIVLRISSDGKRVLHVAGSKSHKIGISKWTGNGWAEKPLAYSGPPIINAALDFDGGYILLATLDRQIQILEGETGRVISQLYYQRRKDITIHGKPTHCAFGLGDTEGLIFFSTEAGHIACWNWKEDHLVKLEDYRQAVTDPVFISLFEVIPETGQLFLTTQSGGKFMGKESSFSASKRHRATVSKCVITDSYKIVSMSEQDQTIRWFSGHGLNPLFAQSHQAPSAIAKCNRKDDILIGTQQGMVWNQPPDREAKPQEIFVALAEPVASLFSLDDQTVIAAGKSGRIIRVHLSKDQVDVIWHSSGFQEQGKIFNSEGKGLCWSIYRENMHKTCTVISLIRKVDKMIEVFRTEGILSDIAVMGDGDTICLAGDSVCILRRAGSEWKQLYCREELASHVAFLGQGEWIAVAPQRNTWLEVWKVGDGLPTVGAIELPGTLSSLSATGDWIAGGFLSGDLISLRFHRREDKTAYERESPIL